MINTPCNNCVFATWDGAKQTGCRMNYLEKYEAQGVLKLVEEEGLEYYVIEGRACRARNEVGGKFDSVVPREKQPEAMRMLQVANIDVVVPITDHTDTAPLKSTIEALNAQSLPPRAVQFVSVDSPKTFQETYSFLQGAGCEFSWSCSQCWNVMGDPYFYAINNGVGYLKPDGWYVVAVPGLPLPADFFARIDQSLNDDLARYSILRPPVWWANLHGLVVQTAFHRSGSIGGSVEKLIERTEAYILQESIGYELHEQPFDPNREPENPGEDKSYLIQNLFDIVPSFQEHS